MLASHTVAAGHSHTVGLGLGRLAELLTSRLFVGLLVESKEEDEVGRQDGAPGPGRLGAATAGTHIGKERSVLVGVEGVRAAIDEEEVDEKLGDLRNGDSFLPGTPDAQGSQGVVRVHQDMHSQVERDDSPRDARPTHELAPAQSGSGSMVIYVEELEGFLLEDEENGVGQLPVLEVVVHDVVRFQADGPCVGRADSVVQPAPAPDGENVLEDESEQQAAAEREEDVVHQEDGLEEKALACSRTRAHEGLQTKDGAQIEHGSGDDGCDGRHGGLCGCPLQEGQGCLVAHAGGEGCD